MADRYGWDGAFALVLECIPAQLARQISAAVRASTAAGSDGRTIATARRFKSAGARGILSVTPYYNKPTQEGLFQHYSAIAGEVGLPIIVYNVPGRTGCNVDPATLVRLTTVPGIVGVKQSAGDLKLMADVALVGFPNSGKSTLRFQGRSSERLEDSLGADVRLFYGLLVPAAIVVAGVSLWALLDWMILGTPRPAICGATVSMPRTSRSDRAGWDSIFCRPAQGCARPTSSMTARATSPAPRWPASGQIGTQLTRCGSGRSPTSGNSSTSKRICPSTARSMLEPTRT